MRVPIKCFLNSPAKVCLTTSCLISALATSDRKALVASIIGCLKGRLCPPLCILPHLGNPQVYPVAAFQLLRTCSGRNRLQSLGRCPRKPATDLGHFRPD